MSTQDKLNELFAAHSVEAYVLAVVAGPTVTRYEIELGPGLTVERMLRLSRTIALTVGSDEARIVAPVNGRPVMGIELPTEKRGTVRLADVQLVGAHPLTIPLGSDTDGAMRTANIAKLPHLLVAGSTGSGKSTFVNTALTTIIGRATPGQVRMVLVDLKKVELAPYARAPHLLCPVITDAQRAVRVLRSLIEIAEDRYRAFQRIGVRNLDDYNTAVVEGRAGTKAQVLPYILVVVDELAELLMTGRATVEDLLARLAQVSRACGIHELLATQSPRHDVVSGKIKVNIPARTAFQVPKATDSRIVLDQGGAEQLLGEGDGLFKSGGPRLVRFQGVYVSDEEIRRAVELAAWAYPVQPPRKPVKSRLFSPPNFNDRPAWVDKVAPHPAPSAPVSMVSGTIPLTTPRPSPQAAPPVSSPDVWRRARRILARLIAVFIAICFVIGAAEALVHPVTDTPGPTAVTVTAPPSTTTG